MRKAFRFLQEEGKKKETNKKPTNKKLQVEVHDITNQISFNVVKTRLDKAQKNVFGNFLYLLDNNSHYQVDIELDFSESSQIQSNDSLSSKVIRETIDPFTSCKEFVRSDGKDYNLKCKLCELQYLVGYLVSCKIKFDVKFPSIETQLEIVDKDDYYNEISNDKKLIKIKNYFKNYDLSFCLENKLAEFHEFMKLNHIAIFIDHNFYPFKIKEMIVPADPMMSFYDKITNIPQNDLKFYVKIAVHWRPIDSFIDLKQNKINLIDINPTDVNYGMKANINLISVLCHIAEYPFLIFKLLNKNSLLNEKGFYSINLYLNGKLSTISLDGLIPCFPRSHPIYITSNSGKAAWAILIEKALAKVFKSYDKIRGKPINLLYKMLTGFQVNYLKLKSSEENIELKSSELEYLMASGSLISCFHEPTIKSNMLAQEDFEGIKKLFKTQFIYPLLKTFKHNKSRIFILRNIFTDYSFNIFTSNLEYYALYSTYAKDPARAPLIKVFEAHNDKSTIVLSEREFFSFFNLFNIISLKSGYETTIRSRFTRVCDLKNTEYEAFISSHYYEIELNDVQELHISVNLKDEEYFDSRYQNNLSHFDLSLAILTIGRHDNYDIQYAHFFEFKDYLTCDVSLTPGKYIIIPRTSGACLQKSPEAKKHVFQAYNKQTNELLTDVLDYIFEDIFLINDTFCKDYLNIEQINNIISRLMVNSSNLRDKFESDEKFLGFVNKYSKGAPGITLKGFTKFMTDIFRERSENDIKELLNNFGYDKNLYPFLNKFYSIKFCSLKNFTTRVRSNLSINFDQIANDIMLKQKAASEKTRDKKDCSPVSIRQNLVYIEGIKNNSRKDDKIVTLDLSASTGAFFSTNSSVNKKYVPAGQTVFFCYLVNISEQQGVEFRRSITDLYCENVNEKNANEFNYGSNIFNLGLSGLNNMNNAQLSDRSNNISNYGGLPKNNSKVKFLNK